MTDSALDSSNEALLARISKLEHAMLVGGAPTRVETPVKASKAEENPTPKPAPKAQEKKVEPAPEAAVSAPAQTKAIRGWSDIAEMAAMGDKAVLPFLKMGKAFESANGLVSVKFPNEFAKSMVERANIGANIRAALSKKLGREISEGRFEFGIITREEDTLSDLDDFIV